MGHTILSLMYQVQDDGNHIFITNNPVKPGWHSTRYLLPQTKFQYIETSFDIGWHTPLEIAQEISEFRPQTYFQPEPMRLQMWCYVFSCKVGRGLQIYDLKKDHTPLYLIYIWIISKFIYQWYSIFCYHTYIIKGATNLINTGNMWISDGFFWT